VREGKVSLNRARQIYRVAIDPRTWRINPTETAALREQVKEA